MAWWDDRGLGGLGRLNIPGWSDNRQVKSGSLQNANVVSSIDATMSIDGSPLALRVTTKSRTQPHCYHQSMPQPAQPLGSSGCSENTPSLYLPRALAHTVPSTSNPHFRPFT